MRSRIALIAAAIVASIGVSGLAYGAVAGGDSPQPKAKAHSSSNRGPRGPHGHAGPPGQNGLQGAKGDPGAKGDQGAEGIAGVDANGIKGSKGDKGDAGPTGAPGVIPWDKMTYRSNSLNALASYGSSLQVNCQSDEHLVYGGYSSWGAIVTESMPAGQGWEATAHPDGSGNSPSLYVTAECVAAG